MTEAVMLAPPRAAPGEGEVQRRSAAGEVSLAGGEATRRRGDAHSGAAGDSTARSGTGRSDEAGEQRGRPGARVASGQQAEARAPRGSRAEEEGESGGSPFARLLRDTLARLAAGQEPGGKGHGAGGRVEAAQAGKTKKAEKSSRAGEDGTAALAALSEQQAPGVVRRGEEPGHGGRQDARRVAVSAVRATTAKAAPAHPGMESGVSSTATRMSVAAAAALAQGGQKGEKPAEGKHRAAGEARGRVVVVDLRSRSEAHEASPGPAGEHRQHEPSWPVQGAERGSGHEFSALGREASGREQIGQMRHDQPQGALGRQTMHSLQERLIPELAHRTGIILREGGGGEIRLILRPESLGSVRIRLSLDERGIDGRIVVDNNNVKDLLDGSLENLRTALRQEGFQTANLEVSVGGRRGRQQGDREPLPGRARTSGQLDRLAPLASLLDGYTVNLVV